MPYFKYLINTITFLSLCLVHTYCYFFSYIFGNSVCTHCPTSLYVIYIIFELEEKNWVFPFPVCNFKLTIVRHVVLSLNPRKNLANTMYKFLRRKKESNRKQNTWIFAELRWVKGEEKLYQWRRKRTTLRYLRDWWQTGCLPRV